MKINNKVPSNSGPDKAINISETTTYVRMSDKFEFVQRTGPISAIIVEGWNFGVMSCKSEKTLEQISVGTLVKANTSDQLIIENMYLVVTDTVEANKMVSLLSMGTHTIVKVSPQAEFLEIDMDITIQ